MEDSRIIIGLFQCLVNEMTARTKQQGTGQKMRDSVNMFISHAERFFKPFRWLRASAISKR